MLKVLSGKLAFVHGDAVYPPGFDSCWERLTCFD